MADTNDYMNYNKSIGPSTNFLAPQLGGGQFSAGPDNPAYKLPYLKQQPEANPVMQPMQQGMGQVGFNQPAPPQRFNQQPQMAYPWMNPMQNSPNNVQPNPIASYYGGVGPVNWDQLLNGMKSQFRF